MSTVLESNRELSRRLASLEDRSGEQHSIASSRTSIGRFSITSRLSLLRSYEFDNDLKSSRPYRKATRDSVDFSFRSSIALSYAWSKLTLSDISFISVVALPIRANEITNGHHYEDEGLKNAAVHQKLHFSEISSQEAKVTQSSSNDDRSFDTKTLTARDNSSTFNPSKLEQEYTLSIVGGTNNGMTELILEVSSTVVPK
jgi:hypothetical protein